MYGVHRFSDKESKKINLPPGSLVYTGEHRTEDVKISFFDYDEEKFQEKEPEEIEECFPFSEKPSVTWINIDGLHQTEIIEKIGEHFDIHPLILEDILSTSQRPKLEDMENYEFIVMRMLDYDEEKGDVESEQISLILGQNFVISFQESAGDVFDSIRERIRKGKGRIRKMGPDYLTYTLIDAIVDHYFFILENFGEKIESMEEEVVGDPTPQTLQTIHDLKRELISLRKSMWPLREIINRLSKEETPLIEDSTRVYLRDVYDHTIQIIDTVETYRDIVSGMLDIYLSSVSNRMNEVMKVLTIIATIFIPLTFIAGIYGMNFEFMPELGISWAYPAILLAMLTIGIVMIGYFRKKDWL